MFGFDWPNITVAKLYTNGAPGVSKTQLTNNGSCFNGTRFFNFDDYWYDPVTYVSQGYLHPKMKAVKLYKDYWSSNLNKEEYECESDSAMKEPSSVGARLPSFSLHGIPEYMDRFARMYR